MPLIKKKTAVPQTVRLQEAVLDAVHLHAAAQDLILSAHEAVATAREDLRQLAQQKQLEAMNAEADARELETAALRLGARMADVAGAFAPVAHI